MKVDDCLIACPDCARWPMVINTVPKKWGINTSYIYVCVGCGYTQARQPFGPRPSRAEGSTR